MAMSDEAGLRVFVSYNHKDKRWLERLKVHLTPLKQHNVDAWDDTRLKPGSKWRQEIQRAVNKANAAVLLISADFLASEFIRTNELPPLLEAAQEKGALILLIIVSPCLFQTEPELSQFHAVNDPSSSLVSVPEGEQEAVFVRAAQALLDQASVLRSQPVAETRATTKEVFLQHSTWTRLIKIGNWIFDEQRVRIIGSGVGAFLLSREEYGEADFLIQAELEFSNFQPPQDKRLGMNAGIIFGWKAREWGSKISQHSAYRIRVIC